MRSILNTPGANVRRASSAVLLGLLLAVPLAAVEHLHGGTEDLGALVGDQNLGAVSFPVSCSEPARRSMERGVALLHHMMYVEARKTFEHTAAEDPGCAMAHWGIAMTLFQPLWPTRPSEADLARGLDRVQAARALGPPTARERAYVEAAGAFFGSEAPSDYWSRIGRFEAAMERVWRSFPGDLDAAAFYALSHLATAGSAEQPLRNHEQAAGVLLAVLAKEPTHPGAIHYTIHANDIDGRAGESLEVVRSYGEIAPSVPHALHMPTHIFVRLGEWGDVIAWNERSAEAALRFPAGAATSHHYPHALDYLIYALLQRGEDAEARQVVERLASRSDYQQTFISAYHLAAIPARWAVERGQWAEAAALPERSPATFPWESFPWPEAVTHFARGLGSARSGDPEGARRAAARLRDLERQASGAGEAYFATQIEISRLGVEAWLARAEGDDAEALGLMREASDLERSTEKHPVTPGALKPASELLGDLLQEMGRHHEAIAAYDASLRLWPRRYNSLLGAARSAAAAGDREAASRYRRTLEQMVAPGSERLPGDSLLTVAPAVPRSGDDGSTGGGA